MAYAKEFTVNIPFILVTGAISEEFAIDIMRQGAGDYILKDRLQRLPAAIQNALEKCRFENERQRYLKEVIASEARFREFFELAPEAILVIDADKKTLLISMLTHCKLLRYSAEEIINKSPVDISPPKQPDGSNSKEKFTRQSMLTLAGAKPVFEWTVSDAAGKTIVCEVRLVMLGNSDHTLIRASLLDITERKHAEHMREKMTADLVIQNKNLEQFAYVVSHNLRSPVANIIGLADVLQDATLSDAERKEMMYELVSSVKNLDEVIKDLNTILQVKREVSEKKEVVRFSRIMGDIKGSIKHLIGTEEVSIIEDFGEADEMLTLKSYFYSIFFNLISNSIKYRREKIAPVIQIKSRRKDNKLQIVFKDNGLGIDMKKRGDQVFGLYKRFHSQNAEGKGMGLFMVKTRWKPLADISGKKAKLTRELNLRWNLYCRLNNAYITTGFHLILNSEISISEHGIGFKG